MKKPSAIKSPLRILQLEQQAETRTEPAKTRSEQALRASELRYRRLFESAKDGILILDDETGRINDANPFLVELLGFSHDEMIGKTVGELSPFKDMESNLIMLDRLQKDGYVRYEDLPLERRDGRKVAVEFVSNVYQAGDKRVIQCNIRDITARKLAEKMLRQLAAIVESSDDAIIGKDLDGNIQSWNAGAVKMFGYSAAERVGHPITLLIPAELLEEEHSILEKIKRGESVPHLETVRLRKDGSKVQVSITVSPIKDSAGKVVGASKVARDITEGKLAEEKIKQLNSDLERRVLERTAQLEAANKELEAFSYSVSHDLRAPLRAVDGFSQVVLEDYGPQLPEACRQDLQTIRHSAQKMGKLIDDLLMFSRLSRLPLNKQAVDTGKLVRGVVEELNSQREGRRIDLRIGELPPCQADPALLKQVWVNLLSNALKYTGKREAALVPFLFMTSRLPS